MVDLRPREALGHDSTVYVLSQLSAAATDELFNSLTDASVSTKGSSIVPWHIENRYYATEIQFNIFDSPAEVHEELKRVKKDIIPALMVIVDNSQLIDKELLSQFNAEMIDVPLVVGKHVSLQSSVLPWEDMMQQCISSGWEYVDLSDDGEDELGGQSGISRVSEALQAHIWPMNPRSSVPRTQISVDSDDDENSPEASTSQHRSRRDSNASSSEGFEDNFAPFVSAAARDTVLSAAPTSPSLDDTSVPTFPSTSDYPPFEDTSEGDPTAHLADMFASFAGLRERAMNMQDRNQKMDYAEEIAMKFAKQLDLLMGDDLGEIPAVQLPEIDAKEGDVAKNTQKLETPAKHGEGVATTSSTAATIQLSASDKRATTDKDK